MSSCIKASASYISIKTLDFPEKNERFNLEKSWRSYNTTMGKKSIVQTHEISDPVVLPIKISLDKRKQQNTTSSNLSKTKSILRGRPSSRTFEKADNLHDKKSFKSNYAELKQKCPESVALGIPRPFVGNCPVLNLTTDVRPNKKIFTLIKDPRKDLCLRNPEVLHYRPLSVGAEQANIKNMVKTAENLITSSESQPTISSICEDIDLVNPLNLDFQGMDYKNTYLNDEQGFQNQMEYRKVRRYKNRRNTKKVSVVNVEKSQHDERVAIPKHFQVGYAIPCEFVSPPVPEVIKTNAFGKLVRGEDKPEIKERLQQENYARVNRYKQLHLLKKENNAKIEVNTKFQKLKEKANATKVLMENDIIDLVQILDRTITTKKMLPRIIPEKKDFPHNLKESLQFRHDLKRSKRILRDRAKVKQDFYKQIGNPKTCNEADLEISSDSPSPRQLSKDHSTNDEDDMEVGQQGSKFHLRGFLYKMGLNLRGKNHQKDINETERKVKGCMTREEWFEALVPNKKEIDLTEKSGLKRNLFETAKSLEKMYPKSAIIEFIKKPLGRHYDQMKRRKISIRKIKRTKVKKFNLINYLYGIGSKRRSVSSLSRSDNVDIPCQTLEYIRTKSQLEGVKRYVQKRRRMHYLGIPCPSKNQKLKKMVCVDSVSDDSDWNPKETLEQNIGERFTLRFRGNMPAPENRESTLRCHPRHPRNYKDLRIPSAIFDETVKMSQVPILKKLKDDKYILENVRHVKETEFGKKFEARHHHDHWDPTQHKYVHITYARKVIRPKPIESKEQKIKNDVLTTFDKACTSENISDEDVNYALSKLNTAELIQNLSRASNAETKKKLQRHLLPQVQDVKYNSLDDEKLNEFPGRKKFIEFLTEIKMAFRKRTVDVAAEFAINKIAYLEELKQDMESIDACLSSLSSSVCTNLTNESGSFLLAGSKKVSLDYIRKSLVPFEEINRSRFEAILIDGTEAEENPFRTLPFAGQQKEQTNSAIPKDSFFTFNTRLQNGKRLRLEVKQTNPQAQLLGTGKGFKGVSQVANDIDEVYIDDLKNRPLPKLFKWNSCRTMIKNALRTKFESMLIQGRIVSTKIYDRRNEDYFQQMLSVQAILERLFSKWEKKEYEAAMKVVHKVKPYYEATDKYKREFNELRKQYTLLNMEIVYIENDWTARTILQNFHYLLAAMEWRVKHDWIHRLRSGELEGFEESIAKRNTTNIRQRDKDDAWAIKNFYDSVYLQDYHPINVVFQNTTEFVKGTENLKLKTFILLQEMHYTLWILAELDKKYEELSDWCSVELEMKKTYAENKCANKYYMEERANQLKKQVQLRLGKSIDSSFSDNRLRLMQGVCKELYKNVVPATVQMDVGPLEQIATISQVLTDLIGKFEVITSETRIRIEKRYRRLLNYRCNISRQAAFIERRIASEMIKVRRNLLPPFHKSKRVKISLRSELKKKKTVHSPKTVKISEKAMFFYRAFHEDEVLERLKEASESTEIVCGIQEAIVPFYFDYFLSINGYQPNYNFKTQIELRDGQEIERFQIKSLLPEVLEKFEKWQVMKKKTMDEHINKNPKMYHDVQI